MDLGHYGDYRLLHESFNSPFLIKKVGINNLHFKSRVKTENIKKKIV